MMLYQKIQSAIKYAMKSKDTDQKDVLKMVVNKSQAISKENKIDMSDDIVMDAIQKELKQLAQTKDSLSGREDCDLYISTISKMKILQNYLPEMMKEDEVQKTVANILSRITMTENFNKGFAMKLVMPELKGKCDNKLISKCVDNWLGNSK